MTVSSGIVCSPLALGWGPDGAWIRIVMKVKEDYRHSQVSVSLGAGSGVASGLGLGKARQLGLGKARQCSISASAAQRSWNDTTCWNRFGRVATLVRLKVGLVAALFGSSLRPHLWWGYICVYVALRVQAWVPYSQLHTYSRPGA